MIRRLALIGAGLALALVWIGWLGAIRDPVITRYRVTIAGLQRPLRIVHLSDIHGSAWDMPEVRIARIVEQANAQRPDLIVNTGDFHASKIWNPKMRLEQALRPLTRLRAPLGVYHVAGNHDSPYWTRTVMQRFGLTLLAGDHVDAGPVQIIGIDDMIMGFDPVGGLKRAVARIKPGKPAIAIAHESDYWRFLPPSVGLFLNGHTHAGQIRVAGQPRLIGQYERYRHGLFRNKAGQMMITSAGIGTTWVPLRIGTTPEIVVIDLQPPGRNSGTDK